MCVRPIACGIHTPPVNRITDKCKNITLPQTSFAGRKNTGLLEIIEGMKNKKSSFVGSTIFCCDDRVDCGRITFFQPHTNSST